jgi:hypothetical protein
MQSLKSFYNNAKDSLKFKGKQFDVLTKFYNEIDELQKKERNYIKHEIGHSQLSVDYHYILSQCKTIINSLAKEYKHKNLSFEDKSAPNGKEIIACSVFLEQIKRLESAGKFALINDGNLKRYRAIRILKPYYIQLLKKYKTISKNDDIGYTNIDEDIYLWTGKTQYEVYFNADG